MSRSPWRLASAACLPTLLLCVAGCDEEPAAPTPAPVVAPVADPLSRLVTDRLQEAAQRRRAEELGVVGEVTPRPAGSGFGLPTCTVVAAADLDGDGTDELVCWSDGQLRFWSQGDEGLHLVFQDPGHEGVQPGEPQKIVPVDFDGEPGEELLIGWGNRRAPQGALLSVSLSGVKGDSGGHRQHHEVLYHADSVRGEVVGLGLGPAEPGGGRTVVVAHYDSRYFVSATLLRQSGGAWVAEQALRRRMASSWAFADVDGDGQQDWIVGRPYGEGKLDPGDLIVWDPKAKTEVKIPSHLGVRTVTTAQVDGKGGPEILFGDGWHYDYGKKARARLSMAVRDGGGKWLTQLIGEVDGQIEIGQIEVVDVDGDGSPEIIAAGDKDIRLWRRVPGQTPPVWQDTKVADGSEFTVGQLRPGEVWLAVAGAPVTLIRLQ